MKAAVVTWMDSSLQNGQVDHHEFPRPERISSVGWLIDGKGKDYVTLAREDMGNGDFRGLVCIPRCCIEEMHWQVDGEEFS